MSAPNQAYACLLALFAAVVFAWSITHTRARHGGPSHAGHQPTGLRIDVNTADAPTLTLLPGVGPGIAEHIILAREGGAVYHTAGDLREVKFIGPTLISRVDPWVVYAPVNPSFELATADNRRGE